MNTKMIRHSENSLYAKIVSRFAKMSLPARASLAFMVCSFLQRGISTLTTPIFTRLLTTDEYGYYTIFNSWLEILSVFTTLKLAGSVFMQALVKYSDDRGSLTASTASLGSIVTIVLYIVYIPLRKWVNPFLGMSTMIVTFAFIASWATLLFEIWSARERVEYRYKALVMLTVATSLAKPISGILAILMFPEHRAEARIISLVIVEIVAYTWLVVPFLKGGKRFPDTTYWKYSLALNIPLIPHYLTRTVLHQSDRVMIQQMIGYSQAGIYGLAYNIGWMLTLVTSAVLNAFNPWIFERIKREEWKRLESVSYMVTVLVALCALAIITVAPEIISFFAPESYHEAVWVIPPVSLSVFFLFLYSLFADFEFYFEKSAFIATASSIGGVLNVLLNVIFIPRFGYIAAGYTTLVCYTLFAVAHFLFMRRINVTMMGGMKVYSTLWLLIACMTLVAIAAVLVALYPYPIIRYTIVIIVLIVSWLERNTLFNLYHDIRGKHSL